MSEKPLSERDRDGARRGRETEQGLDVEEVLASDAAVRSRAADGERTDGEGDDGNWVEDDTTREDLIAQLELLDSENRHLRREYQRARQSTYRRTALGLLATGLVTLGGAAVFPDVRTVLTALGMTGVFAAVLVYYVTPERFVAAEVGERSYSALAETVAELLDQLGMSDRRVYVPTDDGTRGSAVRLFVPQRKSFRLPEDAALSVPLVVTDDEREWGFSARPSGGALFDAFEKTTSEPLGTTPEDLGFQLADALSDVFELVDRVEHEVDPDTPRVTFHTYGSVWGVFESFDHPVASFLAVGFAVGLERPVATTVTSVEPERADTDADMVVTVTWDVVPESATDE